MLHNSFCPYCWTKLCDAINQPDSRSVEHLIPNTILTQPRTKRNGDFFACRKCNSRKGHIDYVLSVVTKAQTDDPTFASDALIAAVTSDDGRSQRFIQMIVEARETVHGVEANIPIFAQELLEYISYLGRGQYFRKRGKLFDENSQVMIISYANKLVMTSLTADYTLRHGTNPVADLIQNPCSESFGGNECVIYSKNDQYLFLFHNYTAIIIKIKKRNNKNIERSRASAKKILKYFPWKAR